MTLIRYKFGSSQATQCAHSIVTAALRTSPELRVVFRISGRPDLPLPPDQHIDQLAAVAAGHGLHHTQFEGIEDPATASADAARG
jgi:hypothetical protein